MTIRICAAVLLFGCLAGIVHVLSFPLQRMLLRAEVKRAIVRGLPDEELTRFTFSFAEFAELEFEDDGREFKIGGVKYDVVRMSKAMDGSVRVVAFRDDEETQLERRIEMTLAEQLGKDEGIRAVPMFLLGWYGDAGPSWQAPAAAGNERLFFFPPQRLLIGEHRDWSPPPRG